MSATVTDTPAAKADPLLHAVKPGLMRRAKDLAWLCGVMYRSAPGHSVAWVVLAVIVGSLTPVQLWAGGRLIDSIQAGAEGRQATSPWLWLTVIALGFLGARFLDSVRFYVDSVIRERGGPAIQATVYRQATGIDLAAYEHQGFYDSIGRITAEVERQAYEIVRTLQDILFAGPRLAGVMILLFGIDWRIGAALLLPTIPMMVIFFRSGASMWEMLSDQTRDRRIATYLAGRITDRQAAREIRLFGIGDWLIERWSHHFLSTRDELRRKQTIIHLRTQFMFGFSMLVSSAGVLWVVFRLGGDLSAGDITVLMSSFLNLTNLTVNLVGTLIEFGRSAGMASDVRAFVALPTPHLPSIRRVADPAGYPPAVADRADPSGAIALADLTFAYPGSDRQIVDGVSLTIPAGQRVAIVGENGAGKTTLLKLILGLYAPDGGAARLDGEPVHGIPPDERQRRMAAVFQHFTRYPFSIADNITLAGADGLRDTAGVERVLETAGMATFVRDQAGGIDTVLSPDLGGIDLSGGQWQRIAIARAAWRDADVLALDEPTAALDPMAEVAIFRRFAALAEGRTTLLVSHRLGMARLADRILVIEHGRVVEDGPHDDLVTAGGRYAELWEMQARWYR